MQQTIPETNYEIIVCNDGGDRAVSALCKKYIVKEVLIFPNKGSYYARNRGVGEATGEYIAFLDADICVPEHWLELGMNALQSADYIGGPVIIDNREVRTPAHYYEFITGFKENNSGIDVGFFVTANLFIKRIVFNQVGGFDDRLRSGGDNEFGMRVLKAGTFRRNFIKELAVLHPPRGFRKLVKKRVRIAEGKLKLNRLYPDRYCYKFSSPGSLIARLVVPPRPSSVKKTFSENNHFGFLSYYLFMWYFKIRVSIGLIWLLLKK